MNLTYNHDQGSLARSPQPPPPAPALIVHECGKESTRDQEGTLWHLESTQSLCLAQAQEWVRERRGALASPSAVQRPLTAGESLGESLGRVACPKPPACQALSQPPSLCSCLYLECLSGCFVHLAHSSYSCLRSSSCHLLLEPVLPPTAELATPSSIASWHRLNNSSSLLSRNE